MNILRGNERKVGEIATVTGIGTDTGTYIETTPKPQNLYTNRHQLTPKQRQKSTHSTYYPQNKENIRD